jgi:Na+-driven multidrug efflux pump
LLLTALRIILLIGLAYWFNAIWGLTGVWWAITISSIILALAIALWYKLWQPKLIELPPKV